MNYAIHNLILWATDVSFFLREDDWTLNDSFRQSLIALWVTCLIWPAFELLSTCCCFIKHVKLTSCWLLKAKSGVIPCFWYALCASEGEGRVPVFKFWYVIESTGVRRGELQQALSICNRRHQEIWSLLHLCHLVLLENPQSCKQRIRQCLLLPRAQHSADWQWPGGWVEMFVCLNQLLWAWIFCIFWTWRSCSSPWGLHSANLVGLYWYWCSMSITVCVSLGINAGGIEA